MDASAVTQSDHAAEHFFATTSYDRLNQLEQRLYDHFKRQADEEQARLLREFLAGERRAQTPNFNNRKRAS